MGFNSIFDLLAKNFQGQTYPESSAGNPDSSSNSNPGKTAKETVSEYLDQYFSGNAPTVDPTGVSGKVDFKATVMLPPDAIIDHGHPYTKHWYTSWLTGSFGSIYQQAVTASGSVDLKDGKLLLPRGADHPIATIDGFKIYDHDMFGLNIDNIDSFLPAIAGTKFFIADQNSRKEMLFSEPGVPALYLEIDDQDNHMWDWIPWGSKGLENRYLPNFARVLPIGRTHNGESIFSDPADFDKFNDVEKVFPLVTKLLKENLPEELPLTALMDLGNDLQKNKPRTDPELEMNMPDDPLKLVRDLAIKADLYLQGFETVIPGNDQLPGIVIGKTGDAHIKLEANATNYGARNDEGLMTMARYNEASNISPAQSKEILRNHYSYITVTYPGGREFTLRINEDKADFYPPTTEEQKRLLNLWGGTDTLIQKVIEDGYINKDGDIKLKNCALDKNGYDIRVWKVSKLSNFDVKLNAEAGRIDFIHPDGFPKITLPLTANLMAQISGEGMHNSLSLKDWVLNFKSNGYITNNGDIEVPPFKLGEQNLPGFVIKKAADKNNEIVLNDFFVSLNHGNPTVTGTMTADINAEEIGIIPPMDLLKKIGIDLPFDTSKLGPIPALGPVTAHIKVEGHGESATASLDSKIEFAHTIALLPLDFNISSGGLDITDATATLKRGADDGTIETKLGGALNAHLAGQVGDLKLALEKGEFKIKDGYAFANLLKQTGNAVIDLENNFKVKGSYKEHTGGINIAGGGTLIADFKDGVLSAILPNGHWDGNVESSLGEGTFVADAAINKSSFSKTTQEVHGGFKASLNNFHGTSSLLPFDLEEAAISVPMFDAKVTNTPSGKQLDAGGQFFANINGAILSLAGITFHLNKSELSGTAIANGDIKNPHFDLGTHVTAEATVNGLPLKRIGLNVHGDVDANGDLNTQDANLDLTGTIDTDLFDVPFNVNGHAHINNPGNNAPQKIDAGIAFGGFVQGEGQIKSVKGGFSGYMSINDSPTLSNGVEYDRKIEISNVKATLKGLSIEGFTIAGGIKPGTATKIKDPNNHNIFRSIPSGIVFLSQIDGVKLAEQKMGPLSEATINLSLNNANINVAGISLSASGQLVGKIKLYNASNDPLKPDFKPLPGFAFEVRNAHVVANAFGNKTPINGTIRIAERDGMVFITGRQTILGADGPQTIFKQYATIKLDSIKQQITLPAHVAQKSDFKDGVQGIPEMSQANQTITYYEPKILDHLAAAFTFRVLNKNLARVITEGQKELIAKGSVILKNLVSPNPKVSYSLSVPVTGSTVVLKQKAKADKGDKTQLPGGGSTLQLPVEPIDEGAQGVTGKEAPAGTTDKPVEKTLSLVDTILKSGSGGLYIKGVNQQSTTTIKIPDVHVEHELADGKDTIMKLIGDLSIKEPIQIKLNRGGLEKYTLHLSGRVNMASLDANHQLIKDKDNKPIPAGEIEIVDSPVDLEIQNTFIKGELNSNFNIPQSTLTGKVTKPLFYQGVLLEEGSTVTLNAVGLTNTVTASIKKLRGDINIETPDITLTLNAPGNPLEKAKLPLKGALEAKVNLTTNHNKIHVGIDKKGFSFDVTDKPIIATIFAKVGEELFLDATVKTQAGPLDPKANPISGTLSGDLTTHVDLKKIKTNIAVNNKSFVNLAGEKLDLSGIIIDSVLDSSSIDYNPTEQTLTLKIDKQTKLPTNPPPTQIEDWLAWPKEKWEEYRAALNGKLEGTPNCNFLAVIEEPLTHIPGVKVPVGKGRVYAALSEDKFTVDLKKYPNKMDGVAALFDKVATNVNEGMIREYPVPTDKMLEGYKGDDIRYNDQQNPEGTFFILGNSDTTNLITESLGFPVNKRIDLKDFSKSKILGRYFKESLPAYIQAVKNDNSASFTSWPLRALTTLGRLNSDLPKMVMMKAVYRGKLTRATTFINFDDKATRGKYVEDKNAVMTSLTYSPFDPQKINKALGEIGGIKKVLDWLPDNRELTVSQNAGALPLTHFELAQDNNDPFLTQASGRVYVLPLTDDDGIKRSVMIFDQALGLTGDLKFLKGKNRDFGVDADPLLAPLLTTFKSDPPKPEDWPPKTEEELKKAAEAEKKAAIEAAKKGEGGKPLLNAGRLASMIGRSSEAIPSDAIPVVANGFMTQFINSVSYRLKTGEWTASPPIAQISSTPEGIKIYPEFLGVNTEKETFTISLTKDTNIDTVRKTLAAGLGIQESETDKYLPKEGDATTKTSEDGKSKFKEIPLKEIFEIPSVKKLFPNFEEFKKLSYATAEMPGIIRHRFRSHGTIYMAALHDIREKVVHMRPGRFHFLSLNSSMFRGNYGPIKEQLEEVGITFMPFIMKKTDHLKMATALSKYEKFDDYAPANYPSSEAVDPTIKEDVSSIKINGLKDEEAQKYYDCSSIAEKGEYCVEAKLDAGQILRHRIRVPNKPIKGFLAPWDMMYIKDLALTENGMYTNAGEWGVTDVVGDDGEVYTMGYNLRILNTKISNETGPAVQNLAFTQMAGFLGGVVKAGAGQDLGFKMDPVVKYKE